jgi:hypothetical protein
MQYCIETHQVVGHADHVLIPVSATELCLHAKPLTKRHLNLIRNTLDAHQCESNYSNNGNCAPAEIIDESERQGEKV